MAIEVQRTRRLWSVDEYQRMVEAGILTDRDHVELIHGEIIQVTPIGPRHMAAISALTTISIECLGRRVVVWTQGSLPLPLGSMPEPDLLLLEPRADFYRARGARPEDVLLVVEVAESSVRHDRVVKMPLYAASGIPEGWLVDLEGRRIEVYREPGPRGYARVEAFGRGATVVPAAFPDLVVPVVEIVG